MTLIVIPPSIVISLNAVSKSFESNHVLDKIHLELEEGKTHVLLGSSGCGKSTILRIIVGLIHYDSGSVRVGDLEVTQVNQKAVAQKVGYVIQEGGLFPHLSASENVSLVAKLRGWDNSRIQSRVSELSELVQLEASFLEQFPKDLSGGQRQRVALMRALMMNPDYLLMDEPLGALDPIIRADLQTQLKRIFEKLHKTVVIVTHDVGEAAFFGHTVTLLQEGNIIQHGKFSDFKNSPKDPFVTEFINAQRFPDLEKEGE